MNRFKLSREERIKAEEIVTNCMCNEDACRAMVYEFICLRRPDDIIESIEQSKMDRD